MHGLRKKITATSVVGLDTTDSDVSGIQTDAFGRQVHSVVNSYDHGAKATVRQETWVKDFNKDGRVAHQEVQTTSHVDIPKSRGSFMARAAAGLVAGALVVVAGCLLPGIGGVLAACLIWGGIGIGALSMGTAAFGKGSLLGGKTIVSNTTTLQTMAYNKDGSLNETQTNAQTQTLSSSTHVKGKDLGDEMLMASDIVVAVGAVVASVALMCVPGAQGFGLACIAATVGLYHTMRQGISVHDLDLGGYRQDRAQGRQNAAALYGSMASVATAGLGFTGWTAGLMNAGTQMVVAQAAGANGQTTMMVGALSFVSGGLGGAGGSNAYSYVASLITTVGADVAPGKQQTTWNIMASLVSGGPTSAAMTYLGHEYSKKNDASGSGSEIKQRNRAILNGALESFVTASVGKFMEGFNGKPTQETQDGRTVSTGGQSWGQFAGKLWDNVTSIFNWSSGGESFGTRIENGFKALWGGEAVGTEVGTGLSDLWKGASSVWADVEAFFGGVSKESGAGHPETAKPGAAVNPAPANPSAAPAVAPKNAPAVSPTTPKPNEQKAPVTAPAESGREQKNAPSTVPEQKPNLGTSPLELIRPGFPLVPSFRVQGTGTDMFGPLGGLSEYFAPAVSTQGSGTSLSTVLNASSSLDLVSALTMYAATWSPRQATGELVKYASNILEGRDYMVVGMSEAQGAVLSKRLTTLSGELAKRQEALAGMNISPEAKADLSRQLAEAGAALKGLDAGIKGGSIQEGAKDELLGRVALAQFDALSALGEIERGGSHTAGSRLMIQAYTDAAGELDLASRMAARGGSACLAEAEIDYAHAGSFTAVAGLMLVTNGNKAQVDQSDRAIEKAFEVVGAKEKMLAGMEADLAKLVQTPGAQQTAAGKASMIVKSLTGLMAKIPLLQVKDDVKNILYTLGGEQFVSAFRSEITKERATLEGQRTALAGAAEHFDAAGSALEELEGLSSKRDWTAADVERFNRLATTAGAQNTVGLSMAMEGRLASPLSLVDRLDMSKADKQEIKDNFLKLRQEVTGLKAQAEALLKSPTGGAQGAAVAAGLETRAVSVWGKTETASEALNLALMTREVDRNNALLGPIGKGEYVNIFTNDLKDAKRLSRAALMENFGSGDAEKMVNLTQRLEVKGVFGSIGKLVVETAALGAVGKFFGMFAKTAETAEAGVAASETAETAGVFSRIIGAYAALGDVKTLLTTTGKMGTFGAVLDLLASNGKALLGGKDVVYGVDMMGHRIVVNRRDVLSFSDNMNVGLKGFETGASFVKWNPLGEGLAVALKGGVPVASYWIAKVEGVGELTQKGYGELAADALQGNGKAALAFTARGVESLESMAASMGTMYVAQKYSRRVTDILGLDPMWGDTFAEAAGGVAGGLVRGARNVKVETLTEQRGKLEDRISNNQASDESLKQQRAIYESQLSDLKGHGGENGNLAETIRQAGDGAGTPPVEDIARTEGHQNPGGKETSPVGLGPVGGGRPADVQGPGRLEPEQRGGDQETGDLETGIAGYGESERRAGESERRITEKITVIDEVRSGIRSEISRDQAGVQRLTRGIEQARQRVAAIDDQNDHISDVAKKLIFREGDENRSFTARLGETRVLVVGLAEDGNVAEVATRATREGADLALVERKAGAGAQYIAMDVAAMNGRSRVVSLSGLPSEGVRVDANTVSYDNLAAAESALDLHMAVNAAPAPRMTEQQGAFQQVKEAAGSEKGGAVSEVFQSGMESMKSLGASKGVLASLSSELGGVLLDRPGGWKTGEPPSDIFTNVDRWLANLGRVRDPGEIDPRIRQEVGPDPEVYSDMLPSFYIKESGRPGGQMLEGKGTWDPGRNPATILTWGKVYANEYEAFASKESLSDFNPTPDEPFGDHRAFERDGLKWDMSVHGRVNGEWTAEISQAKNGTRYWLDKIGGWTTQRTEVPFAAPKPEAAGTVREGPLSSESGVATAGVAMAAFGLSSLVVVGGQRDHLPPVTPLISNNGGSLEPVPQGVPMQPESRPPSSPTLIDSRSSTGPPVPVDAVPAPNAPVLISPAAVDPSLKAKPIQVVPAKPSAPEAVTLAKEPTGAVKTFLLAAGAVLAAPVVAAAKIVGALGKFLFVDAPKKLVGTVAKVVESVFGAERKAGAPVLKVAEKTLNAAFMTKSVVLGGVFSLIDLDAYKVQQAMEFPKDPNQPDVISGNGMMNTHKDGMRMNVFVNQAFGLFDSKTSVRNDHGFLIGDIFQAIGNVLGDIDKPSYEMAVAIKKAVADKGLAFVCCHSAGSAYFEQSLKLLPPEVRVRVYYLGLGPQQIIDGKKEGLAAAVNVWNEGDPIPGIMQNKLMGVVNHVVPGYTTNGRMAEMIQSGELVTGRKPDGAGSPHYFTNYEGAVQKWAADMKKVWDDYRRRNQ